LWFRNFTSLRFVAIFSGHLFYSFLFSSLHWLLKNVPRPLCSSDLTSLLLPFLLFSD
jgi:hypothetical protein